MLRSITRKFSIVRELLSFFWKERMWWLIPVVIILILLGFLMVLAQNSPAAPFIYTLF